VGDEDLDYEDVNWSELVQGGDIWRA